MFSSLLSAALLEKLSEPVTTTPAEFDTFFRTEAARWTKVYKDSGIKLD